MSKKDLKKDIKDSKKIKKRFTVEVNVVLNYLDNILFSENGWITNPLRWWFVTCPILLFVLWIPLNFLFDYLLEKLT